MQLTLTIRTVQGILVVNCDGRIVFGEESAELRDTVKKLLTQSNQLQVTKLLTIFEVFDTEEEAVQSFPKGAAA